MKIIKKENTFLHKNSENCFNREYDFNDNDLDLAVIDLKGRYPEEGFCLNEKVKEIVYIINGEGKLFKDKEIFSFKEGDCIIIEKNEPYYWMGKCSMTITSTPSWNINQYRIIK